MVNHHMFPEGRDWRSQRFPKTLHFHRFSEIYNYFLELVPKISRVFNPPLGSQGEFGFTDNIRSFQQYRLLVISGQQLCLWGFYRKKMCLLGQIFLTQTKKLSDFWLFILNCQSVSDRIYYQFLLEGFKSFNFSRDHS